jgi:hypothetical protein
MPNVFNPTPKTTATSSVQRRRREFTPAAEILASDMDESLFEPEGSLPKALGELEQATRNCQNLSRDRSVEHWKQDLFAEMVRNCSKCRTAFAEWDRDEALRDSRSPYRKRLADAMANSYAVLGNCVPLLQPGADRKLGKAYLRHIGERMDLLSVLETEGRDAYEAKKQELLNTALGH